MGGWSYYFFLMIFNFLIIIGIIKNISIFYINDNNLENNKSDILNDENFIKNNIMEKENEIKNVFSSNLENNKSDILNAENFDKNNIMEEENDIKNVFSLKKNNSLIEKFEMLKKLKFIFYCKNLIFDKHRMIHAIHAITMLLMHILLYFNTDLYDLLLSDVGGFSKFILILIIILIYFVEIYYLDERAIFLLYFFII